MVLQAPSIDSKEEWHEDGVGEGSEGSTSIAIVFPVKVLINFCIAFLIKDSTYITTIPRQRMGIETKIAKKTILGFPLKIFTRFLEHLNLLFNIGL